MFLFAQFDPPPIQKLVSKFDDSIEYIYQHLGEYIWLLLSIILVIVASRVLLSIITAITGRTIRKNRERPPEAQNPRVESVMTLLRSTARYAILFACIIAIMLLFGMKDAIGNFLSAAGIGALAIGFGAQSLVKDVVSGLFLSFENQFSVGDYVKIDESEGIVEAMALRVTYIRSFKGDQIIVPNGAISRVLNYSRGGSIAVVDIQTKYESNTRSILELLDRVLHEWAEYNSDMILESPKILGITAFEESSVKIRVVCKARPMMQWDTERAMRLAVKEAFDATGIQFAYPRLHIENLPTTAPPDDGNAKNGQNKNSVTTVDKNARYKPVWQRERINLEGGNTDDY